MPLARAWFWRLISHVSDSYRCGSHDPWTHYVCGLIAGAVLGALIGARWFESGRNILASSVVTAVVTAYATGSKGDAAWEWILGNLPELF